MSDQESSNKKQVFGIKANTIITALFGLLVSGIGLVNHMQAKASHDDTIKSVMDLKLEIIGTYVSKADFQTSIAALSSTDAKLWEKEAGLTEILDKNTADINLKLQHIEDSLPSKKP
jgi:hypothetical protein